MQKLNFKEINLRHPSNDFKRYISRGLEEDDIQCYGKITKLTPTDEEQFKLEISLITNNMFNADYQFFSQFEEIELPPYEERDDSIDIEYYHPYFYQFVAEINTEQMNYLSDITERWVLVRIIADSNIVSGANIIKGTEIFSASPLVAKAKTLILNPDSKYDPFCAKLNATYNKKNLKSVTSSARNNYSALHSLSAFLYNKLKSAQGIIYSVGLANNSYLMLEDIYGHSYSILYDMGKTHLSKVLNRKEVNSTIKSFYKSRFDAVVLSHWDSDHIIAVGDYDPRTLYSKNRLWIAPDINMLAPNEISTGAVRLACYITSKCKTFFYDNPNTMINLGVPFDSFQIWQGKATPSKTASHQNNIGLMIHISGVGEYFVEQGINKKSITKSFVNRRSNSDISILMCGDCVYDNWPDALIDNNHDILWVPHHGTNKATPDDLKNTDNGIAIISADDSGYSVSFPGDDHVTGLIKKGYSHIFITKQSGNIYFNSIFY